MQVLDTGIEQNLSQTRQHFQLKNQCLGAKMTPS